MSPGSPDFSVALGYGKSSSQALSAAYAAAGWEHLVSLQPAPRDFAELSKTRRAAKMHMDLRWANGGSLSPGTRRSFVLEDSGHIYAGP
jgi:hypothetical protein